jgi:hypothetical protein
VISKIDESLENNSTIAVYHCSEIRREETPTDAWRLALKIAWDVTTPGIAVPLYTGIILSYHHGTSDVTVTVICAVM